MVVFGKFEACWNALFGEQWRPLRFPAMDTMSVQCLALTSFNKSLQFSHQFFLAGNVQVCNTVCYH